MPARTHERMPPQMWAFLVSIVAGVCALATALRGAFAWTASCMAVAIVAGAAARMLSRRSPAPMPHFIRWVLFLPRVFQSSERLKKILEPRPGERLLEIGPGVGIHALPIAASLAPGGILDVLDVQHDMLVDLVRRARRAGVRNVRATRGDARRFPYPDHAFDGAYLVSVLGEVPDQTAAFAELLRVLKPGGRLVVGEIAVDPDFVAPEELKATAAAAGFRFEHQLGPRAGYFASFRTAAVRSCR
jgi:ubiquinone/menaquinone biosynthesis C-methylase UbiE